MAADSFAGRVFSLVGDKYVCLLSGAETEGACAVFEAFVAPGNGTPPHVHHREDEAFVVASGEVEFTVKGEKIIVPTGASITAERGVPHHFRNTGSIEARLIFTVTPAGFENFVAEAGIELDDRDCVPIPMTDAQLKKLMEAAARNGIEILGG